MPRSLALLNPEELAIIRAKGKATRAANTAARKAAPLRRDFL